MENNDDTAKAAWNKAAMFNTAYLYNNKMLKERGYTKLAQLSE